MDVPQVSDTEIKHLLWRDMKCSGELRQKPLEAIAHYKAYDTEMLR